GFATEVLKDLPPNIQDMYLHISQKENLTVKQFGHFAYSIRKAAYKKRESQIKFRPQDIHGILNWIRKKDHW
ncbi:MAG: hypothetical protein AAF518_28575, partial [Spirochaetota bacterium]